MDIGNIFEEWDFSGTVPLPYRVLLMGCIGIFAWASNLHILSYLRVDVSNLLFSSPPLSGVYTNHPRHSRGDKVVNKSTALSALYRSIYTLGVAFLFMVLVNMWMYKWVVAGSSNSGNNRNKGGNTNSSAGVIRGGMGLPDNTRAGIIVPIIGYLTILAMIFLPFNILFKKERYRFLRSMNKALFSGFKSEVLFADVILADILTSFARVFGDLAVALCLMFLDRTGTNADACYSSILVPIMTSIPYFIRLRQCLSEYIESNYTVERHLMNALKYASAFPVIIVSSMQKASKAASLKGVQYEGYFTDNSLFRLWLFFVALNSFYSFYWDIYHDWNLIQVLPPGSGSNSVNSRISTGPLSPGTPKIGSMNDMLSQASGGNSGSMNLLGSPSSNGNVNGSNHGNNRTSKWYYRLEMRPYLHYEERSFYIMAMVLDFLLRTTWMLKLVSNIQIEEYEGGVFTMECLEVLRRWIWVLFRFEAEMVKRAGYSDAMSPTHSITGLTGGSPVGDADNNIEGSDEILMEDIGSWQK
ncbi:protein-ER retention protein [Lobosporangium transversale]|uniref:EXS family-domain-containing protein n=1 Tax=Lobosporangium transversale TaxID=64571 RepID=A0A1Y2G7G0_9FUNG|nr:EXS family-domain-containing protein [Lobosporangium transversale]KAF9900525.1 protein-ER retention protein [Lobosporangium transversale]ORY99794.1 EXS family-domain-containing protein [Lobosporangium transversale]|eukprot:XP_021876028.1 EXS family-domain-containing protein [Lobosporangium transversale]